MARSSADPPCTLEMGTRDIQYSERYSDDVSLLRECVGHSGPLKASRSIAVTKPLATTRPIRRRPAPAPADIRVQARYIAQRNCRAAAKGQAPSRGQHRHWAERVARTCPGPTHPGRSPSQAEWRALGVQQSRGWVSHARATATPGGALHSTATPVARWQHRALAACGSAELCSAEHPAP